MSEIEPAAPYQVLVAGVPVYSGSDKAACAVVFCEVRDEARRRGPVTLSYELAHQVTPDRPVIDLLCSEDGRLLAACYGIDWDDLHEIWGE